MANEYRFTDVLRGMDQQQQADFFKKEDAILNSAALSGSGGRGKTIQTGMLRDFTTFDKAFRDQNPNVSPETNPVYQRAMALRDQVNSAKWAGDARKLNTAFAELTGSYTGVDPSKLGQSSSYAPSALSAPPSAPRVDNGPSAVDASNQVESSLNTSSPFQAMLAERSKIGAPSSFGKTSADNELFGSVA
jgi:hypothetical protein